MALVGLAAALVGWILMFVVPGSRFFSWIIIAIGFGLIVAATIFDFRKVRKALGTGRGRFGVGTGLAVSLFLGVIVLVNGISITWNHRFDFTGLAQFTLTSQTKDALEELDSDVEITTLFTPAVPQTLQGYTTNLLDEYEQYTDRLTVDSVDPDLEPDEARRYGLDQAGAQLGLVIVSGPEGDRRIYGPQLGNGAEYALTSAILEVSGNRRRVIYMVTGHGEQSVRNEYGAALGGMQDNLFAVAEIDLEVVPEIPADASAIVIAGPRTELPDRHAELLDTYLNQDGRLLLLLDPASPSSFHRFVEQWWVEVDGGTIIDQASYVAPLEVNPLIPSERNVFQLEELYFFGATAVRPSGDRPAGVEMIPLAWTSNESWVERDAQSVGSATFTDGEDLRGPVTIGVLVTGAGATAENPQQGMKIVVVGDSDFATNMNFQNGGNSSLFLTAINWLTAGEEVVSIDRKVLVTRRLILNQEQARFLNVSSIGLLPFALLVIGTIVWWRRRQ